MPSTSSTLAIPAIKLLLVLLLSFSLATLSGPMAYTVHFPSPVIRIAHANEETSAGAWIPAGAQEQTLLISEGDSASTTPINWLLTNQVDSEDWPLTASQQGSSYLNCLGSATILCTLPVPDHGYFGLQFNLANVFWGIPMEYGNSNAGLELRQGIAHLFNRGTFSSTEVTCAFAQGCSNDQPTPTCNVIIGCTNAGLPAANPCSWDTIYSESNSQYCVVGAPGGTAYNCSLSTTCPNGTLTGDTTYNWQARIGSPDFCAAANHFVRAFTDAGITGVTPNANCELNPPPGGWPSSVTRIAPTCVGEHPTADVCLSIGTVDSAETDFGRGLGQDICALFSPGSGAWTTLLGQNSSCDPFLQTPTIRLKGVTLFRLCPTSTNGIPDNCWGMYLGSCGNCFPFDTSLYYEYNSLFASQTTVTCTSVDCSAYVNGSTCNASTPTSSPGDYFYACDPAYDNLTSLMESAPCLTVSGDPDLSMEALPTFRNCSGGIVGSGTGSTSCIGSVPACTAVSAGYQAEDELGKRLLSLPIWSPSDVQARLSNWLLGDQSKPGFITAIGGNTSPSANIFDWLNAYSGSPAISGTYRPSFVTTVDNLNPFDATSPWDMYMLSMIYDGLFVQNPLCTNSASLAASAGVSQCSSILQNIDWMTTSHSFLCYPGGPSCNATNLGYGNATYFANTSADLRLTLNRSNHWQDAGPVTAWDVKYSFMNLNATGAFQATSLSDVAHINVLDEFTVDLNLKAKGPFTELFIGGVTVIPGHIWSACGATAWSTSVTQTNLVSGSIVNAPEDACVGTFSAPSIVTVGGSRADSLTFDPLANNFLIGSGAYTCKSIGGSGHPVVGFLGGGCSVDDTQQPAFGLGDFVLTRTDCTLASSGTNCGVAGEANDYFHSSGALAKYIWTGDIGSGSADFSKVLIVDSCHSATPSANCPHYAQGIGNPGGTGTNPVGLSQRLAVNSFKGISWIGFSTEKTTGTQLILTCKAGYTLPGTTVTPCSATNAGWSGTVLPGIGGYAATLYEVGSNILSTSTSTLSPASIAGCSSPIGTDASAYPNAGYDC